MPTIDNNSDALARLWEHFKVFDGARQGVDGADHPDAAGIRSAAEEAADGRVSSDDLQAVADNAGFSDEQRAAAEYLLEHPGLIDGLDGAADGGHRDDRISQDDVVRFIAEHRHDLSDEVVVIADAAELLGIGDHDARLAAFAGYVERRSAHAPGYGALLIDEIVRQDKWAPDSWITRAGLDDLLAAGEIDDAQHGAVADLLPTPTSQLAPPADGDLRVLNLNLGMGAGNGFRDAHGTDPGDIGDMARLIADSDADVVTLQEVFDEVIGGSGNIRALEDELERLTGDEWNLHFAEARENWQAGSGWSEPAFGVRYGNAILVREGGDIASSRPAGDPVQLPGEGIEQRVLHGVTLELADGSEIDVFNVHTADRERSTSEQRAAQFERIGEVVAQSDRPVVLAGDFNQGYSDAHTGRDAVALRDGLIAGGGFDDTAADAGPTSNHGFGARIDYVLQRGLEQQGDAVVVDGGSSDHAGIVVDLRLPAQ